MLTDKRLRVRTTILYALGILVSATLLTLLINWMVSSAFLRNTQASIEASASFSLANPDFVSAWQSGDQERLHTMLGAWVREDQGSLSALDLKGNVVATSTELASPTYADPHPAAVAMSNIGEPTFTVAAPIVVAGETVGYVRWTQMIEGYSQRLRNLQWAIAAAIFVAAGVLIALMVFEVERAARIIRRVTSRIERAAAQDFDGHVLSMSPGEMGDLTNATNRLVDRYRKATKRRAHDRDRLNTVLTKMNGGALILNEYGEVKLINPAATQLMSTTREKALHQSFVQVAWDHRIAEVLQRAQATGKEESETLELGQDRIFHVTVTPFLAGDANGDLVLINDLTTVRRLEKVRRDFISNISHELRTPLASLNALVETLKDGAMDDPPAAQRFLSSMEVEVEKMRQMVEELLELSRVESGQMPLVKEETAVSMLVSPAVDRLKAQAERAQVILKVALPDGLPTVLVDAERVQQVLINLVHNAIKFTPAGGTVTVSARASLPGNGSAPMVTLSVEDTGIGIPAADQARIFERFYKTDRARATGGTGLGLAIAKHTVQVHGGEIKVESSEGFGSTFSFTLPVFPAQLGISGGEQDEDSD